MKRPSEKFYGKQLVQEYEDLLNYCKENNRAFPINWYKVMEILETRKLPRPKRWQRFALPLSYSRLLKNIIKQRFFISKSLKNQVNLE